MIREIYLCFVIVLSALVLFGCAKTNSSNVRTEGMFVSFNVYADSAGSASAQATFQVGGSTGTYLDLDGGDSVTVNGLTMTRTELLGIVTYSRTLPAQQGSAFRFVFNREDEEPKVADVTVPEPVSLAAPADNSEAVIGQPINVSWTPGATPSDTVSVWLDKCPESGNFYAEQSPDTGYQIIPASYTQTQRTSLATKLRVRRERHGSFPSGFEGGAARAMQDKTVTVTLSR